MGLEHRMNVGLKRYRPGTFLHCLLELAGGSEFGSQAGGESLMTWDVPWPL